MDYIDDPSVKNRALNTGSESDSISNAYFLIGIAVLISLIPILSSISIILVFIGFILLYIKRNAMNDLQHRLLTYDIIVFVLSIIILVFGFVAVILSTLFSVSSTGNSSTTTTTFFNSISGELLLFIALIEIIPFGLCYLMMGYGIVQERERTIFSLLILGGILMNVLSTILFLPLAFHVEISNIKASGGPAGSTTGVVSTSITHVGILSLLGTLAIGLAFLYLGLMVRRGLGEIDNGPSHGTGSGEPY